ncbi:C39 family peptidase [Lactobacillus terrae]|uniref:C39 family peptidase n=1 Tax=Lactobacillus terrae TaxID=2269374 RepID=UPI001FE353D1|nr:C39 family peptidase [Lactobacillus terrae]
MKINRILSYSFVALTAILLATSVKQVNASTTDTDVSVSQQTETDDIQNSVSNNTESVNVNSNNDLSNTNSVYTQSNNTQAIQESAETQSDSTISSEIVTVVYKHGAEVHSYNGYGENAIYNGTNLATGTSWIVNEKQKANDGWWYEVGNDVWLPEKFVVSTNSTDVPAYNWLTGVPLINQNPELPNGCEITAITMMLNYAGVNVDKNAVGSRNATK